MATKGVPQMVKDVLPTVDNTKLGTDDHFTVLGEVDSVASRWKQFGGALNIPLSVLATIQTSHPTQPGDCLGDVLSQFLSMNYNNVETVGPPTWRLIVCALAHAAGGNNRELALEVAEDHKINSTTVSYAGTATCGSTSACNAAPDNRSILKEPPNQKDLIMITYNAGSEEKCYRPLEQISLHWRDIAGYLKLSTAAINNAALKPTPTDSAREVMTSWTGSNTKASWSKLIKAMKVVPQLTVSARELETALLNIVVDSD